MAFSGAEMGYVSGIDTIVQGGTLEDTLKATGQGVLLGGTLRGIGIGIKYAITPKIVTKVVGNPKLHEIKTLIKNGEVKGKNIISQIDGNTQMVFRNDTGVNAHPVKPKGYINPVDHYNVEIQTKTPAGKWSYHIIFDEKGNIIDTFD